MMPSLGPELHADSKAWYLASCSWEEKNVLANSAGTKLLGDQGEYICSAAVFIMFYPVLA